MIKSEKEEKYNLILRELIVESFKLKKSSIMQGKVVSGSMRYFLPIGSKVEIIKVKPIEINIGDIIVFEKDSIFIIHRVIFRRRVKNKFIFMTKGDSNIFLDKDSVEEEKIIGKARYIKKFGLKIDLEKISGRLISYFYFLTSYFVSMFMWILNKVKILFYRNKNVIENKLIKYYDKKLNSWVLATKKLKSLLGNGEGKKVAEITLSSGFTEIGLYCLRKGMRTDYIEFCSIDNFSIKEQTYDYIIISNLYQFIFCSNLYNLLEKMYRYISSKGKIFILEIYNEKNCVATKIKKFINKNFLKEINRLGFSGSNIISTKDYYLLELTR